MTLHLESAGSGPELVAIHGWGLHGGLWQPVLAPLALHRTVHCVDLPGHGYTPRGEKLTLDSVCDGLHRRFSGPVTVMGWSLGGLFALHWALRYPEQVERLILVASSPCFRERPDWPFAMNEETLAGFAADLHQDYRATLKRFLLLQLMGDESARACARDMQQRLFAHGDPDPAALDDGLTLLRDVDLRAELPRLQQPTLLLYGARDRLVPVGAADYLQSQVPHARLHVFADSAHAPHWSHPVEFAETVKSFLYE